MPVPRDRLQHADAVALGISQRDIASHAGDLHGLAEHGAVGGQDRYPGIGATLGLLWDVVAPVAPFLMQLLPQDVLSNVGDHFSCRRPHNITSYETA